MTDWSPNSENILETSENLRWQLPQDFHDQIVEYIFAESGRIAGLCLKRNGKSQRLNWQAKLDWMLTSKWTGFPAMLLVFAFVLWLTIAGANVPSAMLATLLIDTFYPVLVDFAQVIGFPWWLKGALIDGMYLTTAWVISVMLPPMAIFFPLFTLLEDFGYLPRIAFNLDRVFQKTGAHGKQALSMAMGYGCNAAGIIATRIIDSPREKLIAIITNNFSLCNGRWPTQILIASLFMGSLVSPWVAGFVSAAAVLGVAVLGILLTFLVSFGLSRTILKGESSTFSLELPPYRPPRVWRTLYTSLIDRTLFVLWRAVVFALPAGLVIWASANIPVGDVSLVEWMVGQLDPMATVLGLTGVILVAYIVAIPANEIVIPTILMLTVLMTGLTGVGEQGTGVMFETDNVVHLREILKAGGWTTLTALCLMIFSLCHNPCSTTIYTIYKETRSWRWTLLATFLPLVIGIFLCIGITAVWQALA